jgi:hypothetical protein
MSNVMNVRLASGHCGNTSLWQKKGKAKTTNRVINPLFINPD